MTSTVGRSAVVVPVPGAEAAVDGWRQQFDPSAVQGMPAHITVLVPFLDVDQLTPAVLERLRRFCAEHSAIEVTFARLRRSRRFSTWTRIQQSRSAS